MVPTGTRHTGVRRRMCNLPLLGELLAAVLERPRGLPPLPAGGDCVALPPGEPLRYLRNTTDVDLASGAYEVLVKPKKGRPIWMDGMSFREE
jgi:hypothetical protein